MKVLKLMTLASIFLTAAVATAEDKAPIDAFAQLQNKRIVAAFRIKDGVQNYQCKDGKWKLIDARATLLDGTGKVVGQHLFVPNPAAPGSLMPAWKLLDGSFVTGKKIGGKPSVHGGVDQLALELHSNSEGLLGAATHAERVDTVEGLAPTTACAPEQASLSVRYDARYVFIDSAQ